MKWRDAKTSLKIVKSKIHDTFSRIYRQLMAADLSMNNEEDGEQIEWRRKKKRSELATTVDWVEHEFIHLEGMYLTITEMYKIESNHISVKFWQEKCWKIVSYILCHSIRAPQSMFHLLVPTGLRRLKLGRVCRKKFEQGLVDTFACTRLGTFFTPEF